jgi:D-alanyl-D-alanine carboxypeptidase
VRIAAAGQPHIQRVSATGGWAVQVGAYTDPDQARRVAESVRNLAPSQLGSARAVLGTTAPFGNRVLFRARLSGLSWENALSACGQLARAGQTCVAVPPGQ